MHNFFILFSNVIYITIVYKIKKDIYVIQESFYKCMDGGSGQRLRDLSNMLIKFTLLN